MEVVWTIHDKDKSVISQLMDSVQALAELTAMGGQAVHE